MVKVGANVYIDNKGNFPAGVNNVQTALDSLATGGVGDGDGYRGGDTDFGVGGGDQADVNTDGKVPSSSTVAAGAPGAPLNLTAGMQANYRAGVGEGGNISEVTAGVFTVAPGPAGADIVLFALGGPTVPTVLAFAEVDPVNALDSTPDFTEIIGIGANAGQSWEDVGYNSFGIVGFAHTENATSDMIPRHYNEGNGSLNRTWTHPEPSGADAAAGGEVIAFPGGAGPGPVAVAIPALGPALPTRRMVDVIAQENFAGAGPTIGHGVFGVPLGVEPLFSTPIGAAGGGAGGVFFASGVANEVLLAGAPALVLQDNAPVVAGSGVRVVGAMERLG